MSRARDLADSADNDISGTLTVDDITLSGNITVGGTVDGRDLATDGAKLDGVEANATADQTGAEIKAAYEGEADTNAYTDAEKTKLSGIETGATADQTITAGSGLTGGGTGDVTISHADTSSVSNSDNSGNTFIQDLTFDGYGHVTAVGTGTVSVGNGTLTVQGTGALGGSGTFTANQSANTTISISHDDTSSQSSVDNSGATVIQDVTLDGYGHVTGLGSKTMTLADLGYTGATNANYITNNNQLTNGAGYSTYSANQSLDTTSSPTFSNPNLTSALRMGGTQVLSSGRALTNISSIDATTAAAIGNAGVGGSDWYQSNWLTKPFGSRHIVSDGSTVILSPSSGGYLFYSTDNGNTFTYTTSGFSGNDTANGAAINGNVVCIAGNWNTVKRSTDYGATWGTTFNTGNWMTCIGNSGSTFIAGGENGKVARSTNNGASWSTFQWPHGGNKIMGVEGYGSNWVLVGENGSIAYSTNNGSSFTAISTSPFAGRQLQDVKTDGNGTWVTGGESGRVWFSTNNGVSWTEFKSGTSNYVQDFATDGNGNWILSGALGYVGHILSGTTLSSSVSFSGGIFAGTGGIESVEYANDRWFALTQQQMYYYDM